eukprot:1009310-Prymnesium_polylepis.1
MPARLKHLFEVGLVKAVSAVHSSANPTALPDMLLSTVGRIATSVDLPLAAGLTGVEPPCGRSPRRGSSRAASITRRPRGASRS